MKDLVTYVVQDGVGILTLQRPEAYNSFDESLCSALLQALQRAEADSSVKVILLVGAGKAFSGGGDVKAMYQSIHEGDHGTLHRMAQLVFQITLAIKSMKKLVVFAVQGAVAGAAFNMALAADLTIAAEDASFIQAFVKIGLLPDAGGLYLLTRSLGINKAMQLAVMGDVVSAEEGKDLGFVYRIVSREALTEEAFTLCQTLAKGPCQAYEGMKALMWESELKEFPSYGEQESHWQGKLGRTEDYKEGVSAFYEKRAPKFRGQ